VNRFSSRRQPLDESFLNSRLAGPSAYDRIAGYFSSSILEVAGEAIESVAGPVRMVCNSDLDRRDVETARAANYAMRREWCEFEPEKLEGEGAQIRFRRLYELLRSGKLTVKVLPSERFGLVHGKAGIITSSDGSKTSFLGSINETYAAWKLNYELLWEDDSAKTIFVSFVLFCGCFLRGDTLPVLCQILGRTPGDGMDRQRWITRAAGPAFFGR
jgi:hypothetical protein